MDVIEVYGRSLSIKIIKDKIQSINTDILIEGEAPTTDRGLFIFRLLNIHNDRRCIVKFNAEFLEDLNDYTGSRRSKYWNDMEITLTSVLIAPIEKYGLIPYTRRILKQLIFEHIKEELKTKEHINKFNLLGKPYQEGSLERSLGAIFTDEERVEAGVAFEELINQSILIPTYKDLISPEDWIKIREGKKGSEEIKKEPLEIDVSDTISVVDKIPRQDIKEEPLKI
jgi:hypothetical protein